MGAGKSTHDSRRHRGLDWRYNINYSSESIIHLNAGVGPIFFDTSLNEEQKVNYYFANTVPYCDLNMPIGSETGGIS